VPAARVGLTKGLTIDTGLGHAEYIVRNARWRINQTTPIERRKP
jgi:hypothetical protein